MISASSSDCGSAKIKRRKMSGTTVFAVLIGHSQGDDPKALAPLCVLIECEFNLFL